MSLKECLRSSEEADCVQEMNKISLKGESRETASNKEQQIEDPLDNLKFPYTKVVFIDRLVFCLDS